MLGTGCRWGLVALAPLFLAAGCSSPDAGTGSVEVENAWVRLPAVPGRPAAAYFDIRTDAGPATLLGVATPAAVRTEMHETVTAGGVTTMRPIASVTVPADDSERFAPGGKHVMLFDVAPGLKPGATIKLALAFAGERQPYIVEARAVGASDPPPAP